MRDDYPDKRHLESLKRREKTLPHESTIKALSRHNKATLKTARWKPHTKTNLPEQVHSKFLNRN